MLSAKQSNAFSDRYCKRYGYRDDVIDKTSQELLGISNEEDKQEREAFLKTIIPNRDSVYKIRKYGPETIGHKVLNNLWLNYGPK